MTRLRLVARPAAVRALGALLLASLAGCVPVTRLEEAQSVAEVEAESRRRAAIALAAERERAAKLEASLAEREAALQEQQRLLDEQRLATSITEKERDESAVLVEQLRGELSRAGDHLRAYSEQKAELERELADTEPPADGDAASMPDATPPPAGYGAPDAKGAEIDAAMGIPAAPLTPPATDPTPPSNAADLGAVARQIRQALAAGGLEKKISVKARQGALLLMVPTETLFEEDSAELRPALSVVLKAIASLAETDPRLAASLREARHDRELSPTLAEERWGRLARALQQHGLDGRVVLEPLPEPVEGAPTAYEIAIRPGA
ncbi:MAG TPA: hypothetical protein VKY73_23400 [Polyangiaceae bacterium]|nr:hypothetical protein [Polyangiaceae bacterium]